MTHLLSLLWQCDFKGLGNMAHFLRGSQKPTVHAWALTDSKPPTTMVMSGGVAIKQAGYFFTIELENWLHFALPNR